MAQRDLSRAEDFYVPPLTADELARVERYKLAYALCAMPDGYACIRDAERVVDRMRFVRWMRAEGKVQS